MARSSLTADLAGAAGTALRWLATVLPGLAGLALMAYGAWLAWPPAGWMTAGGLLLVDRAWEQIRTDRSEP
ncbi:hypothetical protein FHS43_006177 [Streptosporangium becharense]|uniref:Uncharacterized protein n=1 Tax=Streptosporangium becharense TaxID=1816182 RepID=A0A7W9IGH2_9ACTN|nr:hypothetical protein [Streptosporangium becharense]MBB2914865.1 hypothetical protein [Streptosporangium becharense]MBB5820324.1 hypothetical protein [Streptosporangium becharense]